MKGTTRTLDSPRATNLEQLRTLLRIALKTPKSGGQTVDDLDFGKFVTTPVVVDFTVAIKGGRLRLDIGGSSLLAGPDGWGVLDPHTGRVLKQAHFDENNFGNGTFRNSFVSRLALALSSGLPVSWPKAEVTRTNKTKRIAGHVARGYDYTYNLTLSTERGPKDGGYEPPLEINTGGTAWVAEKGPYIDDPALAMFFDNVGKQLLTGNLIGPAPKLEELAARGPVFAQEERTVWLVSGLVADWSEYSFELTSVEREPMDDDRFAGFEKPKQGCDCSCAAWDRMKEMDKHSKQEIADNPEVMALSMCAPKCATQWIKCDRKH